jgi:hypothetical protein
MLDIIIVLMVSVSSVWVYMDATKNHIGKTPDGGFFNLSAGLWAVATLLLWIIAFPAYLIKRKNLIQRASEHPVAIRDRGWKTGLLCLLTGIWFLATLSSVSFGDPALDGAVYLIKQNLKNPESFSLKSHKVLWSGPYNGYTAHLTMIEYYGQNGYGATVPDCNVVVFYEDGSNVYWNNEYSPLDACPGSEAYRKLQITTPDMTYDQYIGLVRRMHFPDQSTQLPATTEPQASVTQADPSESRNIISAGSVVCESYKSAMKVWAIESAGNPYVNIPADCLRLFTDMPYHSREDHGSVARIGIESQVAWTLPQYLPGY